MLSKVVGAFSYSLPLVLEGVKLQRGVGCLLLRGNRHISKKPALKFGDRLFVFVWNRNVLFA